MNDRELQALYDLGIRKAEKDLLKAAPRMDKFTQLTLLKKPGEESRYGRRRDN